MNAYSDVGPRDVDVVAVAWRDPDVLVHVMPGSFRTWFVGADSSHGVAFTEFGSGERVDGDGDNVFGLVWIADGEFLQSYVGPVPPPWVDPL